MDVKEQIKNSSMSGHQWAVVLLLLLLVMSDGFDIAVISLASPYIQEDWQVSQSMLGYILSAALLGMAIGSFLLSPLADRIGRRKLLLIGTVINTVGVVASGFSTDPGQLLVLRFVTGLGIGCMITVIGVMLNEFSSRKRYGLIMGVYAAGISMGASVGAALSGPLLAAYGWPSAFLMSGVFTAVLLIACWIFIPESVDYLVDKGRLSELNKVLTRIRQEPLTALPPRPPVQKQTAPLRMVFGPRTLARTLYLMFGYAFLVVSFYFLANWNPALLSTSTGDNSIGVTATMLWNFGGMVGCLAFGVLAAWFRPRLVNTVFMFAAALMTVVYGLVLDNPVLAVVMVLLVGFMSNAGIAGYYAIIPPLFPSHLRATGYGMIIGIGRLAAVAAPILGGWLLELGWSPGQAVLVFAVPLALSGLMCLLLDRRVGAAEPEPRVADAASA